MTIDCRYKSQVIHGSITKPDSEYYTKQTQIESKIADRNQV